MIPGILILQILDHENFEPIEKFVLLIGLSVALILILGIALNIFALLFDYKTPLSLNPILIVLNVIYIAMIIVGYQIKKPPVFDFKKIGLTSSEKAVFIPLVLFPMLSIIGMYLFNTYGNNWVIYILLTAIPVYILLVTIFRDKFTYSRMYPVIILSVGLSLMLLYALRSNHILGFDSHYEFFVYITTLTNQYWMIITGTALDSALSISTLPAIFQILMNIGPEFLFRILYVLLCSITPLIVYIIATKYVDELHAFLAAFFFMLSSIFLITTSQSRTSLALLFIALCLMVILNKNAHTATKDFLIIVFISGCIFSHYTSAYIFFSIIFIVYLIQLAISRKKISTKFLSIALILFFLTLMIFWYQQIFSLFFRAIFDYGFSRGSVTLQYLSQDSKIQQLVSPGYFHFNLYRDVLLRILSWDYMAIWIFTEIGILIIILSFLGIFTDKFKEFVPRFSEKTIDIPFIVIALVFSFYFFLITYASFIFQGYGVDRLNSLILIISSIFLVFGIVAVVRCAFIFENIFKVKQLFYDLLGSNIEYKNIELLQSFVEKTKVYVFSITKNINIESIKIFIKQENTRDITKIVSWILVIIIIIKYFYVLGLMDQISGNRISIIYNQPIDNQLYDYGNAYQFDQEIVSANWLNQNIHSTNSIVYIDDRGSLTYYYQKGIKDRSTLTSFFPANSAPFQDRYIYLTHTNTKNGKLIVTKNQTEKHDIKEYSDVFAKKILIYNNDISKIYL